MGWVTERHKCTLGTLFEHVYDFVERDVDEANTIVSELPEHPKFDRANGNVGLKKRFYVSGWPIDSLAEGDQQRVTFELDKDKICIKYSRLETLDPPPNLELYKKWDWPRNTCSLDLNGDTLTPEEVSQKALEPLFFDRKRR